MENERIDENAVWPNYGFFVIAFIFTMSDYFIRNYEIYMIFGLV